MRSAVIIGALKPYPDAARAVGEALHRLEAEAAKDITAAASGPRKPDMKLIEHVPALPPLPPLGPPPMSSLARDLHLSLDAVSFARAAGFEPDQWQAGLLADPPRRGLLCCSRQSGKSTTVSLLALHVASFEPDSLVVLVAPAQRQSAELLRTIRSMAQSVDGLPELRGDSVLRIEMANGSRILALPGDGGGKPFCGLANCRLAIVDEAAPTSCSPRLGRCWRPALTAP